MTSMVKLVKEKIEEYGIIIFKHHLGDDGQYVYMCDSMVVFVHDNDHEISIAFQATTKPEDAANMILIFNEIPDIEIDIMESFIYCGDNKLICGSEAYQLIKDTIKAEGASAYAREVAYTDLLENVNCHEC